MAENTNRPLGERLLEFVARCRLPSIQVVGVWKRSAAKIGSLGITKLWQVFAGSALAGIFGTAVVALLSTPAKKIAESGALLRTGLLFLLALLLYRLFQKIVLQTVSEAVEHALDDQRSRMAAKVAELDLRGFEELSGEQLRGSLARYYATISDAIIGVLQGIQSLVLVLLTMGYLASISLAAATLSAVVFAFTVTAYRATHTELENKLRMATQAESAMWLSFGELIDGFKELRLDILKRAAVLEEIRTQSGRASAERSSAEAMMASMVVFVNSVSYLLAGAVVFLVPLLGSATSADSPRLVAVVLFMIGPIGALIAASNQLATARFAINGLFAFEAEIDILLNSVPKDGRASTEPFASFEAKQVRYSHRVRNNDISFAIGPLDFSIAAGEIVFVSGGNGSGKTTAIRVLTGLYPPASGEVLLNGIPLAADGLDSERLRNVFGTVFADVHIFNKLYALPAERYDYLKQALRDFGIDHKLPADLTQGFDPSALSSGQRKRLALAIALAEDRPVLVLDEWAADQDPQSRERFYRQVLPRLRAELKTIIAITHDDKYFDVADRRYHMEDGRMTLLVAND